MLISQYFDKSAVSLYQPDKEEQEMALKAKQQYERGHQVLTQNYPELNDRSVIEDEQNGKKIWNAYVDESSDDPYEAWKWRGTRSEARKRGIAMHAQLTAGFLFAGISAQDPDNNEDRAAGDFMRGIVEWMAENSDYNQSFLQVTMGMLMNPVSYMGAEFAKVTQKVREKTGDGYNIKKVLDEELSGFRAPLYSASDIMITNAYVQNIQRQTCVIKNKYLDYADAQKKYGSHPNFTFVQRGVNSIFNEADGLFYDVRDPENPDVVKETICSWRSEDLELHFLGGVYMGAENVEHNPMNHRDLNNQPKYDVVPFGYSRISEHFFFYKSLMNNLQWEDSFYDEFSRNVMNRELLDLIPPTVTRGDEDGTVNTSIMFPGASVSSKSKDFDVRSILPPRSGNPYAALSEIKKSIEDSSISDTQSGQLPEASQKATAIIQATQSSRTLLKGVGRSLGQSIVEYTRLIVDIGVRFLSIPQIEEITGGSLKERYRQFMLPNRVVRGKSVGKVLRFDSDLVGRKMSEKERVAYSARLLEESDNEEKFTILVMNPEMAPRMKYLISYDPEEMFQYNQQQMQVLLQNMYGQVRNDPLLDADSFMREYMYAFFKSKGDELILKNPIMPQIESPETKMPTPVATPVGGV